MSQLQRDHDRADTADAPECDHPGIRWWNSLTETQRAFWCRVADSARPVDAWEAAMRAGAAARPPAP